MTADEAAGQSTGTSIMGRREFDVLAIVGLVLIAVSIASFRSEFRLRPEMPAVFFDGKLLAAGRRASEEKIARAYWKCAVEQVQWKYGYAHRLPDDPPEEFSVSPSLIGPVANDAAVRRYYWHKLHTAWSISSVWKNDWGFSFVALHQSLRTGGDWWKELVRSVVRQ
jgi:hypothetical protein